MPLPKEKNEVQCLPFEVQDWLLHDPQSSVKSTLHMLHAPNDKRNAGWWISAPDSSAWF